MAVNEGLVGIDKVMKNLNASIEKMKVTGGGGVLNAALFVSKESAKLAPIVSGNLRASRFVTYSDGKKSIGQESGEKFKGEGAAKTKQSTTQAINQSKSDTAIMAKSGPTAQIGFGAVYAMFVHENRRAGQTGGISPQGKKYTAGRTQSGKKSTKKVFATEGQWKFLETALKQNSKKIMEIIRGATKIK